MIMNILGKYFGRIRSSVILAIIVSFISLAVAEVNIVGGRGFKPFKYPWIATIKYKGEHFCSGVLLNPTWILTTAQCNQNWMPLDQVSIEARRHNFTKSVAEESSTVLKVVSRLNHPKYKGDDDYWKYDLSLWKVNITSTGAGDLDVTKWTSWPTIDRGTWSRPGTNASLFGWGASTEGGNPQKVMLQANYFLFQDYKCIDNLGGQYSAAIELCGGTPSGSGCTHDGGAPVLVEYEGNSTLLGIHSWAQQCGSYPNVITRLQVFRSWIANVTSTA